uniref:Uncharacterized protein n=1 Tax=Sphaerodactylus townsendi TaxID=933632 RepID=A0ACB8F4R7_9SAUR
MVMGHTDLFFLLLFQRNIYPSSNQAGVMESPEIREVFLLTSNSTIINTSSHRIEYSFGGMTVIHLRHMFAAFCGVTLLIGFAGNLFMLLVLIEGFQDSSSSSISTMTNTLMVNITISDLIFLLYNVTVLLFTFVYEDWNMGAPVCVSSQSFSMWTMFCSFYSMVATSILRYMSVVHPTYSFSTNRLQRFLLCMLMWFMGFTVSIPNWIHQGVIVNCPVSLVQGNGSGPFTSKHPFEQEGYGYDSDCVIHFHFDVDTMFSSDLPLCNSQPSANFGSICGLQYIHSVGLL